MFNDHMYRSAAAYRRVGADSLAATTDKHQIVHLLFQGFLDSLQQARGALARHDVPAKCAAITRCVRIVEDGLRVGVDKARGGALAQQLDALYAYSVTRLVLANARNDDQLLVEVQALIEPIAQSWQAMQGGSADQGPAQFHNGHLQPAGV